MDKQLTVDKLIKLIRKKTEYQSYTLKIKGKEELILTVLEEDINHTFKDIYITPVNPDIKHLHFEGIEAYDFIAKAHTYPEYKLNFKAKKEVLKVKDVEFDEQSKAINLVLE